MVSYQPSKQVKTSTHIFDLNRGRSLRGMLEALK